MSKLSKVPVSTSSLPYRREASALRLMSRPVHCVSAGLRALWGTGVASCGLLLRWCVRQRFLTAPKDLDDAHSATAAGAWFAQGERGKLRWFLRFQFG